MEKSYESTLNEQDLDAFNRLPESVKQATQAKWEEQQARARAYQTRLSRRCIRGAVLGAFGSGSIAIIVPGTWLHPLAMALTSALLAVLIVHFHWNHLFAMIAYGANAVVLSIMFSNIFAGSDNRGYGGGFVGCIIFCSWIFHVIVGFFIARLAEDRRFNEDAF